MKNIIVIAGPTGVGKTKLSIQLAKLINAEIINADSMQVYKNLNIGTAKIKDDEKENIIHHLFDIVDVNKNYTIFDYQKNCRKEIEKILKKGKRVILVGGSGLYIRAALYDYKLEKENIKNTYIDKTNNELFEMVKKIDSNSTIHINNRKRLIRFLQKKDNNQEILNDSKPIYDFDIIGLTTERKNLYNIIDTRVDNMIKEGLINEVKVLYDKKINSKAINTGIGYKELYKYFDGSINIEEAISLIKRNSRRYAKRQYTFFNHQFSIKWFETDYQNFSNTINSVYNYLMRWYYAKIFCQWKNWQLFFYW